MADQILVVVLDSVSAARVTSLIRMAFPDCSVDVIREDRLDKPPPPSLLKRVIVMQAELDTLGTIPAKSGGNLRVICIFPTLVVLSDLVAHIRGASTNRWLKSMRAHMERLASNAASVSMEALYYRPGDFVVFMRDWAGMPSADLRAMSAPDLYSNAVAELLCVAAKTPPPFRFDVTYSVLDGALGTMVLGNGWSRPEAGHTWNASNTVECYFPVPPNPMSPPRIRINGMVVAGAVSITAYVDDVLVTVIKVAAEGERQVEIDLPLSFEPNGEERYVKVTLTFDGCVVPASAGLNSDSRNLAFSFRSFSFYSPRRSRNSVDAKGFISTLGAESCELLTWRNLPSTEAVTDPPSQLREFLDRLVSRPGWSWSLVFDDGDKHTSTQWSNLLLPLGRALVLAQSSSGTAIFPGDSLADLVQFRCGRLELLGLSQATMPAPLLIGEAASIFPYLANDRSAVDSLGPMIVSAEDFAVFDIIKNAKFLRNAIVTYTSGLIIIEPIRPI